MTNAFPSLSSFGAKTAPFSSHALALTETIEPDLLVPSLKADTKIGAIKELVDLLYAKGVVKDSLSFLQDVLGRENIESTLLADRVAMPHARSRVVNRLGMAMGIAPTPIDFPSGDERRPVQIICLIAAPPHASDAYLAFLGALAHTLKRANLRRLLLRASSAEELYDILAERTLVPSTQAV